MVSVGKYWRILALQRITIEISLRESLKCMKVSVICSGGIANKTLSRVF
jgi:hypothetical protein